MKALLTSTAVLEASVGLGLLTRPSLPVAMLFGSSLDSPVGLAIARVAGAALLSLGVACWLSRNETQGRGPSGLVAGLLVYNVSVALILATAGLASGLTGVALWPAVALHTMMAFWCVASLRIGPTRRSG